MRIFLGILLLSTAAGAWPQGRPDFSGVWKQDKDRSEPKRNGEVTLRIEHREPELTVETSILRNSGNPRHALQKYTTDGKVSVSTGADGDEFHTSVSWKDSSLVFSIEEHEDGRILLSRETWSLIDRGEALQRVRERPGGEKQVLIFRREQPLAKPAGASVRQLPSRSAGAGLLARGVLHPTDSDVKEPAFD